MVNFENKFVQGLDAHCHTFVIGNGVGVARAGYGIVKIALSALNSLVQLITHPRGDLKTRNIKEGFKQLGRGLMESIPIIGTALAIYVDDTRAKNEALKKTKNDIPGAVTVLTTKMASESGMYSAYQEVMDALIQHQNMDSAYAFYTQFQQNAKVQENGPQSAYNTLSDTAKIAIRKHENVLKEAQNQS